MLLQMHLRWYWVLNTILARLQARSTSSYSGRPFKVTMEVRVRSHVRRRVQPPRRSTFVEQKALTDVDAAALESARKDFDQEDDFADKVLAGKARVEDYPLYGSYVDTIDAEARLLQRPKTVLFVGSGPVPLSAILLAKRFPDARVDIMDISPSALKKGAEVARAAGVPLGDEIASDAKDYTGYAKYDVVVLAMEAGPTTKTKRDVMHGIFSRIRPGTSVLLRGSRGMGGGDIFVETRKLLPHNVEILRSVSTWGGAGETMLTRRRQK